VRYTRADGVEFPLHYEVSPLKDAQGVPWGAICVLIDLSQEERDRKNIEAQRQNLLTVANQVTEVSASLHKASLTLSTQMDGLARNVDTTAAQTGELATAMDEMNATVLEVAKNASDTADASGRSNKVARDGGAVVRQTVGEINEVAETTQSLAQSLGELSTRAENIGQVMGVINDIADQTNLLALNAAIEAARAGEHGRGFAVVADEVRKLAEKTMTATKEVEQAISSIQDGTRRNISEMDGAVAAVARCTTLSGEAGRALQEIVQVITSNAAQVGSMAAAAEQQSMSTKQISHTVGEINGIVSETAGGIRQTDQAVRDLSDLAQGLHGLIAEINKAANGPTATEVSGETARSMFLQDGEARTSPPRRADRW
jgi:Methyl-accepting chemotaxis protein